MFGGGGGGAQDIAMIFFPSHLLCKIKSQMGGGGGRGQCYALVRCNLYINPF